jgi:hypothetical protein
MGWALVHHALQSACMQQTNPMNDPALPAQASHDAAHLSQLIPGGAPGESRNRSQSEIAHQRSVIRFCR